MYKLSELLFCVLYFTITLRSTWSIGRYTVLSGGFLVTHSMLTPITVIVDQEQVVIHLEKINKQQWWENVLKHHPKIDVRKIVPENSKLSDLDGEMRYLYSAALCKHVFY